MVVAIEDRSDTLESMLVGQVGRFRDAYERATSSG
jgi:hypothetical protein